MQNRERLLKIIEYLYYYTDDDHSISTTELTELILGEDTPAKRKTIKADIEQLMENKYIDIICHKGSPDYFNWGSRLFDVAEIKFLIDSVNASNLLTSNMSESIIRKLRMLVSVHQLGKLDTKLYMTDHKKSDNQQILYTVDHLTEAIHLGRKISFQYWDYNEKKEKVLSYDGKRLVCNPCGLAFSKGRYYMVAYSQIHDLVAAYRVDLIANLKIESDSLIAPPEGFELEEYMGNTFGRLDQDETYVTLLCTNDMLSTVIDYYGQNILIKKVDEEYIQAEIVMKNKQLFFAWLFLSGGKLQIIGPESLKEEYQEMLLKQLKN